MSKPHMSGTEISFINDAFESNFVAPIGHQLDLFEEKVANYLGENCYCLALASGTAALHLGLIIAGVERESRVWISSMTFAGGIFPVAYQGGVPEFFDLDPSSWTISCDLLEERLFKAKKENRIPAAVVPTDLYGQGCDMDRLESLADQYGFKLIFDSAESLGAEFKRGRKCGTAGDASILSFNGNKIITTSGGGMLVSRSKDFIERARFLATQARDPAPHYQHSHIGYNYRLSNISAAIGVGQMTVLDDRVSARRAVFERYRQALDFRGVEFMPEPTGYRSSRWLTAAVFDPQIIGVDREQIRVALAREGIESRPLWKPMHLQPVFAGANYYGSGFDEMLFERGLCLPSGSDLTNDEQDEVIGIIKKTIGR